MEKARNYLSELFLVLAGLAAFVLWMFRYAFGSGGVYLVVALFWGLPCFLAFRARRRGKPRQALIIGAVTLALWLIVLGLVVYAAQVIGRNPP
jgi:uncharacterized membrane protein YesL